MHHTTPEMNECIENCQTCHATCLRHLSQHCLEVGGAHATPTHVRLMMDCVEICAVSANFMLRGSTHHAHICAECAEICEQCAASCEALGDMDECVAACRTCAETCRAMAQMG